MAFIIILAPKIMDRRLQNSNEALTKENEQFVSQVEDVLSGFNFLYALFALPMVTQHVKKASLDLKKRMSTSLELKQLYKSSDLPATSCHKFFWLGLVAFLPYMALSRLEL